MVAAERRVQQLHVEVAGVARRGDRRAAERGGVEDHPPSLRHAVATPERARPPGGPGLVEEEVGAGDPEVGDEALERLAERLGVVRGDRHRRHEADRVARVDRRPAHALLVRAEGPVEDAVAELLERAAGVPGLDVDGAGSGPHDGHREEVVVDDRHALAREVVPGAHGLPRRAEARPPAGGGPVGEDDDPHRRAPPGELVVEVSEVALEARRVGRREHHPGSERQEPPDQEPGPDGAAADGDAQPAHRPRTRSTTRSVERPSRCSKWRSANGATFSSS